MYALMCTFFRTGKQQQSWGSAKLIYFPWIFEKNEYYVIVKAIKHAYIIAYIFWSTIDLPHIDQLIVWSVNYTIWKIMIIIPNLLLQRSSVEGLKYQIGFYYCNDTSCHVSN